jgi:hypothetical protein
MSEQDDERPFLGVTDPPEIGATAPPVETFNVWIMASDQTTQETHVGAATDLPSAVAICCAAYSFLQERYQKTGRMVTVFDGTNAAVAWIGVIYQ